MRKSFGRSNIFMMAVVFGMTTSACGDVSEDQKQEINELSEQEKAIIGVWGEPLKGGDTLEWLFNGVDLKVDGFTRYYRIEESRLKTGGIVYTVAFNATKDTLQLIAKNGTSKLIKRTPQ